jgi:hypothetical protein
MAGKIALIQRGTCDFSLKAASAQKAGAIGVIIFNEAIPAIRIASAWRAPRPVSRQAGCSAGTTSRWEVPLGELVNQADLLGLTAVLAGPG